MPVYQYRGMNINLLDFDRGHKEYFEAASQHRLVIQKCSDCGKLRWEPGGGCPFCQSIRWEWQQVSGKGTIYSYQVVHQAIQPAFRDWTPYAIVLVELDEQRRYPTEHDGIRLVTNLVDDSLNPEKEENVAIGKRVEVVFIDVAEGFSVPQFKLSNEPPQGPVWQFPG